MPDGEPRHRTQEHEVREGGCEEDRTAAERLLKWLIEQPEWRQAQEVHDGLRWDAFHAV